MRRVLPFLFLAAPAFADPQPPPTISVGIKVDGGKDSRHYTVKLVDKTCGKVEASSDKPEFRDEIKVCATQVGAGVKLEVEWKLSEKDRRIANNSELVLQKGVAQEIDGGTAKLTVAL